MLQIPTEVLSNIFQEAIAPATNNNSMSAMIPPYKTLARLCEVCSLWHQVVNDTPALWSTIFSTYPIPVIEAFIRRSRDADIWFLGQQYPDRNYPTPVDLRVAIRILNQVHRLASFDAVISAHHVSLITLRQDKVSTPMTSLPQSRTLPDTLFLGNRPPKLRHLHLDGFDIPWNSPLLVNLTTLSLTQSAHCSKRPSYQEFFAAFRNMPTLEQVSLCGCLPRSFPHASSTKERVVLRQLVKLTVSDDFAAVRRFLDILDVPKLASLALSGHLNDSEPSALFNRIAVLLGPRMKADPGITKKELMEMQETEPQDSLSK
ncbi:hypothetical protein ONZ45_g15763 [Pleurotus djamor]|nr:hypothetical protein ONZ45_g15763 [Pleurotus djamor]